jgi:8-hydroxy-5-deazaflavin:NADPH oxidoreductase
MVSMRIGILGTGTVGQTLGLKLAEFGHSVMLDTRDPGHFDTPKGRGPHARTHLGDITTARATEMMFSIGHAVMLALSPAPVAFKGVRN